jgi:hypothetical protein
MLDRIKAAWHDPVWSKVIAAVILAVAGLTWAGFAVIASGVSGALERAAVGLRAGRLWFGIADSVPHWLLLLMLVCIVLLVRTVRRQGKRLDNLEYSYWHHVGDGHVPPLPPPEPEPEPDKIADGFAPTPGQRALLECCSGKYSRGVPFKVARRVLENIDPTATHDDTRRALELLKGAGAVKFLTASWNRRHTHPTYGYTLTRPGGQYMRKLRENKRI